MKQVITRRLFAVMVAVMMLAAFSLPFANAPAFDKAGIGAETVYAEGEIPDEAWSFDAETGQLKGFADGTSYDNPADLVIPSEIGGTAVKSIGDQAFMYSTSASSSKIKNALKSVTIPEGIVSIGRQAFQRSVRTMPEDIALSLPASLETLDYRAFYGWDKITKVTFAEGSKLETVGEAAFYSCSTLADIELPEGLKTIGVDAFRDTSIKKISIPDSVETIGRTAFALTLVDEFKVPAGVTSWNKTAAGADGTGTSVMFFRTARNKAVSDSGSYSQGTLEFTRVTDTTGLVTASNSGAVVNPQPVTINYVDAEGNKIKDPEEAVGAEYNTVDETQGTYSTQYSLNEGGGDGHLYFDYVNPFTGTTYVYSNSQGGKDWAAALIGGNYFSAGKEYTFKAPKVSGYTEPSETVTKTITKEDHEVTFVYAEAPKVQLTAEGDGLTTDPAPGEIGDGSEVTATIEVPEGKKIDKFTINDEDFTDQLKLTDGKYTYKFEVKGDTAVKVTYKDLAHINVFMTVSDEGEIAMAKDEKPMALREVDVTDLDGDDVFTFDEALVAAHKQYNSEDGYSQGGMVNMLWGKKTTNNLFFINGQGIPNGVAQDAVQSGDYLTASINKDAVYYSDWISRFPEVSLDMKAGFERKIQLVGHLGMAWEEENKKDVPLSGVQLGIFKNGAFEAIKDAVTDKDGKAAVTFAEPGEYLLTAKGTVKSSATDWNLTQLGADVYGTMDYTTYDMSVAYTEKDYGDGPYPADEIKYIDYYDDWKDLHYLHNNQVLVDAPIIAPAMNVKVTESTGFLKAMRVGAAPGYELDPLFEGEPGSYTFLMPENITTLAAAPTRSDLGAGSTITAKWTNLNNNTEQATKITGTFLNLAGFRKADTPSGTSFTLEVEKDGTTQEYKFTNKVMSLIKGLSLADKDGKVKYSPAFSQTVTEYTAEVLDTVDKITVSADPYAEGHKITIAGETAEDGTAEVTLDKAVNVIPITVKGEGFEETTYTLTVNRVPSVKLSFATDPADSSVLVTAENGDRALPDEEGKFTVKKDSKVSYTVTKPGYAAEAGTIEIAEDTVKEVKLKEAPENTEIDPSIPSDFPNFRGNDINMAIVDIETPVSAELTQLNWVNREGGYSWPQIIVGDYVVTATGKNLRMIDKKTGETKKTATMAAGQSYTNVPMTYKDGVIYCPCDNGVMQAFNAKTLESLYVLKDPLGGQAQSVVTISGDYGYVGFMNNGGGDVHYLCFTLTDEDPENETEEKHPTWTYTQAGGFYWAMPVIVGDYLLIGTEDGTSASNNPAYILAMDKATGKVIDRLSVRGDVRTAIAYDAATDRYYASTAAGDLMKFAFDKETGKFGELKVLDLGSTLGKCTPVVYKGVIYVGLGNFSAGTFVAVDAETMTEKYRVPLKTAKGQIQGSYILSTAYEESTGYIHIYMTYNGLPGGVDMVKVKPDETDPDNVICEQLYDADGYSQYCNCSLICDADGNLYYKNDTGNVFSVGPVRTSVETMTAEGGNPAWDKEFEKARSNYKMTVDPGTKKVTFKFAASEGSTLEIAGEPFTGTSYDVSLENGEGKFEITAKSGANEKKYTVDIRERLQDASLSALLVNESNSYGSAKALTPAFDPAGKDYIVYSAGASRSFENVWPDASDVNATVKLYAISGVPENRITDPETGEIEVTATSGTHSRYACYFDASTASASPIKLKIAVTSESGFQTEEYFVTITKSATPTAEMAQEYLDKMDTSKLSGNEKEAVVQAKKDLKEAIESGDANAIKAALTSAMNTYVASVKAQDAKDTDSVVDELLEELNDTIAELEEVNAKAEQDMAEARASIAELEQAIKDAKNESAEAQEALKAELQASIDALNAAEEALAEVQEQAAAKITELETALADLSEDSEEEISGLKATIADLESQLEEARKAIAAAQQAADEAGQQAEAADKLAAARLDAIKALNSYTDENAENILASDKIAVELEHLKGVNAIREAVSQDEIDQALGKAKGEIDVFVEYKKAADAAKLEKVAGFKVKAQKGGKAKVTWKKNEAVTGYQIFRSLKKKSGFKRISQVKKNGTVKFTNKKLKKGKNYFYRMRTFTVVNGISYYGKWTTVKKIKAK